MQNWLSSGNLVVFGQSCCIQERCFYLGKSGCFRAKVDVFWQIGCVRGKMVIRAKLLYLYKVVVFG